MRRNPYAKHQQAHADEHLQFMEDEHYEANEQLYPDSDTAEEAEAATGAAGENGAEENAEAASPVDDLVARLKAEMEDARMRQAAEMENYKKRLAREHQEQLRFAAEKVLGDLLPTLDNLELAMQYGSKDEVCKDMMQGVAMTHKLLLDAVTKHGLTPVGETGEPFNPEIHEAVGFDSQAQLEPNHVARVLQRGYKLGDRLLRPAKVMITQ